VLTHRLLPSVEAAMGGRTTASILDSIIASVPVPEGSHA
jgi:MoxR-like ATPase